MSSNVSHSPPQSLFFPTQNAPTQHPPIPPNHSCAYQRQSHTTNNPQKQKPQTPDPPDPAQHRHRIQHHLHINQTIPIHQRTIIAAIAATARRARRRARLPRHQPRRRRTRRGSRTRAGRARLEPLESAGRQYRGCKTQVAEHPDEHDGGAETLVVVFLFLFVAGFLLLDFVFRGEGAQFSFVLTVQVFLVGRDLDIHGVIGVGGDVVEFGRRVGALGAPGDVVGVAEGVDVEDVDVHGREEDVLKEGGKHVPRIQEEETHGEVENVCREEGDDERVEFFVGEEDGGGEMAVGAIDGLLDGFDDDEDGGEGEVDHQDDPEDDHGEVEFAGALRSVAQGEDETGDKCDEIEPLENDGEVFTCSAEEVGVAKGDSQDTEDEEKVALKRMLASGQEVANDRSRITYDSKPGEELVDELVQELEEKRDLADARVAAAEDLVEMEGSVHGGEKGAVQPSSSLHDEIGDLRWYISDTLG